LGFAIGVELLYQYLRQRESAVTVVITVVLFFWSDESMVLNVVYFFCQALMDNEGSKCRGEGAKLVLHEKSVRRVHLMSEHVGQLALDMRGPQQ